MQISTDQAISSTENTIVGVAFPVAIPGIYDYALPESMQGKIEPGMPVKVPVRSRLLWGVVVELKNHSDSQNLKEVAEIRGGSWSDSNRSLMELYRWIASYYKCSLGRVFRPLVNKGIINSKAKMVAVYAPSMRDQSNLKPLYRDALNAITDARRDLTKDEIVGLFAIKPSTVQYLIKNGYLTKDTRQVIRKSDEMRMEIGVHEVTLSQEQQHAVDVIADTIGSSCKPFLLHGITGSGKTHVYTALTRAALDKGYSVIILVPEISLTPQTIERFRASVGDCLAVIHSHMSDGERRDSIQEIVTGTKKVVIGVRSAILVPMDKVGLIIVDEEHDGSYKQSDLEPRYHARDVAVMRGHFQKAAVVLGSATPSLESFYNAGSGKYQLLTLQNRFGQARLPNVEVIDMNKEHQENNWTPVSRFLKERIEAVLAEKRQIILLLNRRGFSTFLLCKDCGKTYVCQNCSVNLRYHKSDLTLKCHLCGFEQKAPEVCPGCGGEQLKFKGTGIQKAEELIQEMFPQARIIRMDQDSTRRKGAHVALLGQFARREADILLGTQMVAKGLNFPGVALVGVLQADTGLHFPDFRASERTFQLLSQVAGRAGRSDDLGEVVIQTYFPEETAIEAAKRHDYHFFYDSEIEHRNELGYPPFGKVTRIVFEGTDESYGFSKINQFANHLQSLAIPQLQVLGPTPAVLARVDNFYRYSLLLKSPTPKAISAAVDLLSKNAAHYLAKIRCIVDIDAVNML